MLPRTKSQNQFTEKKKKRKETNRKGKLFPSFDVLRKFLIQSVSNLSVPLDYLGPYPNVDSDSTGLGGAGGGDAAFQQAPS